MGSLAVLLQEAMRLRPVASTGVTRRTEQELRLLGYTIPAGTIVLSPFDPAHRWEGNWPDRPDDFVPVGRPASGAALHGPDCALQHA